jgi:hypothetical protein
MKTKCLERKGNRLSFGFNTICKKIIEKKKTKTGSNSFKREFGPNGCKRVYFSRKEE